MYSPSYSSASSEDDKFEENLDELWQNMDLFPNLLDVPVGLNTKKILDMDDNSLPWMQGEVELSKLEGEQDAVGLFELDEESSGQPSPASDTGISSGTSPTHEVNLTYYFSDEAKSPADSNHQVPKSISQAKQDNIFGAKGGLSKNAIAARENRMKKKKYVQELEQNVHRLSQENASLKSKVGKFESSVESLETEVTYLRNVLANVDELVGLVKSVQSGPCGAKLASASALKRRQSGPGGEPLAKKVRSNEKVNVVKKTYENRFKGKSTIAKKSVGSGICFHVNNGQMSLELCSGCSVSAVKT